VVLIASSMMGSTTERLAVDERGEPGVAGCHFSDAGAARIEDYKAESASKLLHAVSIASAVRGRELIRFGANHRYRRGGYPHRAPSCAPGMISRYSIPTLFK